MNYVVIHRFKGKSHPKGGYYIIYQVVSGPNPFGPRGGLNGKFVKGEEEARFQKFIGKEAKDEAEHFAIELAVREGMVFLTTHNEFLECQKNLELLPREDDTQEFNVDSVVDTRERLLSNTTSRKGQEKFRKALLSEYDGECVVSGCSVIEALDAAHIHPYLGYATNHIANGLLLRSDIHKLFDKFLISISDEKEIMVSKIIRDTEYGKFHRQKILHSISNGRPSSSSLSYHYQLYCKREKRDIEK